MGWNYGEEERLCIYARALSLEQRQALTWEEAGRFVPADTLAMARWSDLDSRRDCTPWQAVCRVLRILDDCPPGPGGELPPLPEPLPPGDWYKVAPYIDARKPQ